jgi:MOSC domain-containing protein YiiM
MNSDIELLHFYISDGHNFFGHHGRPPGSHPMREVPSLSCVAGRGLEGDRFFDHQDNYKGQITFFAHEIYGKLRAELGILDKAPCVFRRNVITSGVDLNQLIGVEFELQGVRFLGTEECKPCHWMNQAFGPGAEDAMGGHGGLRARILTSGVLHSRLVERRMPQLAVG